MRALAGWRRWGTAVQLLATLGLLLPLFRGFDWAALGHATGVLPGWLYLASMGIVVGGQALYVLKWRIVWLAMGVPVSYLRLAEQYLIAMFFNTFLPSSLGGDSARIYYLGSELGFARVASSVLLDRFLGFFALTALSWSILVLLALDAAPFLLARGVLAALLALFFLTLAAFGLLPARMLGGARGAGWPARLLEIVARVGGHARSIVRAPWPIALVLALVLCHFMLIGGVYREVFRRAGAPTVPYWAIVAALMSIGILSNLPISISGLGVREQSHFLLFGSLGVSKELAVTVSLVFFSQTLILSLAGALLWLRRGSKARRRAPSVPVKEGTAAG